MYVELVIELCNLGGDPSNLPPCQTAVLCQVISVFNLVRVQCSVPSSGFVGGKKRENVRMTHTDEGCIRVCACVLACEGNGGQVEALQPPHLERRNAYIAIFSLRRFFLNVNTRKDKKRYTAIFSHTSFVLFTRTL